MKIAENKLIIVKQENFTKIQRNIIYNNNDDQ